MKHRNRWDDAVGLLLIVVCLGMNAFVSTGLYLLILWETFWLPVGAS